MNHCDILYDFYIEKLYYSNVIYSVCIQCMQLMISFVWFLRPIFIIRTAVRFLEATIVFFLSSDITNCIFQIQIQFEAYSEYIFDSGTTQINIHLNFNKN